MACQLLGIKKAFAILHSDPRMLVVGAQIGAQRFAIVSAHACTTAATAVDGEKFWCELAVAMRRVPRGYVPILLIDANARFEHGTLAPIKGCNNATKLRELAHQNDMWLSGNTDKHGRPLVTWVAPGSNTGKACLDYIAIPQAWSLGAEVVGDPGLLDVHAGFDHFPVAVDFEACVAYHKCEKTVGIDVEQLHSPEGQAKAEQIFANAPTIPWHVDVDSHLESVNEYLAREFSIAFPRCRKPRNPALSEISWRIVAQRRQLRRQLERSTSLQHRLLLHTCLRAWQRARRDNECSLDSWRKFCDRRTRLCTNRARIGRAIKKLNSALRASVRQDEAQFTKSTFAQARCEGSAQLYGLLRAVLKTGRRYRAPALTRALRVEDRVVVEPAEVKLELGRHFAQAEKAKEVPFTAVQQTQACLGWDDAADAIDVEGFPNVAQIASAFASMRSRRAPGISGLPADIFKHALLLRRSFTHPFI